MSENSTGLSRFPDAIPVQYVPRKDENILTLAFATIGKVDSLSMDIYSNKPESETLKEKYQDKKFNDLREAIISGKGLGSVAEKFLLNAFNSDLSTFDELIDLANFCDYMGNNLHRVNISNMIDNRYPYGRVLTDESRQKMMEDFQSNMPIPSTNLDKLRREADVLAHECLQTVIDNYLNKCNKRVFNVENIVMAKYTPSMIPYDMEFNRRHEKFINANEKILQQLYESEDKTFYLTEYSKHIKKFSAILRQFAWVKRYSKEAFLPRTFVYGQNKPNIYGDEILGQGGEGMVTKASLGRLHQVALKPHQKRVSHEEVKQLFQLIHPNVIQLIGATKNCSCYEERECTCDIDYIVMEMHNLSVEDHLKNVESISKLKSPQRRYTSKIFCVGLCQQVCNGMVYLNSKKLIHRDLKPHNILITHIPHGYSQDALFKIADFGLVKTLISKTDEDEDFLPSVKGTPQYMAPELILQTSKSFDLVKKVDAFSFAVMLYRVLLHLKPYENLSRNQILALVPNEKLFQKFKLELPQTVPQCLRQLFYACYSWNPNDRPSFDEMGSEPFCLHQTAMDEFKRMSDKEFEYNVTQWRQETLQHIEVISKDSDETVGTTINSSECSKINLESAKSLFTTKSVPTSEESTTVTINSLTTSTSYKPFSYLDESIFSQAFHALKEENGKTSRSIDIDRIEKLAIEHNLDLDYKRTQILDGYGGYKTLDWHLRQIYSNVINFNDVIALANFYESFNLDEVEIQGMVKTQDCEEGVEISFLIDTFRHELDSYAIDCAKIIIDSSLDSCERRIGYSTKFEEFQNTPLNSQEKKHRMEDFDDKISKMTQAHIYITQCIETQVEPNFSYIVYKRHLLNVSGIFRQLVWIKRYQLFGLWPKSMLYICDRLEFDITIEEGPKHMRLSDLFKICKVYNSIKRKLRAGPNDLQQLFRLKHLNVIDIIAGTQSCECHEEYRCNCNLEYIITEPNFGSVEDHIRNSIKEWDKTGIKPLFKEFCILLCIDVKAGMAFLNTKKLHHGNLKPHNIILMSNPYELNRYKMFKVVDSELIELITSDADDLEKELYRNPRYMAPELMGQKHLDDLRFPGFNYLPKNDWEELAKADVFSLAVIIYRVLLMLQPYDGLTDEQIQSGILEKKIALNLSDDVPKNMKTLFDIGYKFDSKDRHSFENIDWKVGYDSTQAWNEFFWHMNQEDKSEYERRWKSWREEAVKENSRMLETMKDK